MTVGLMWFREDIRIKDNTALYAACQENKHILAIYVIDHTLWKAHNKAACQIDFILRNLFFLQTALSQHNIPLLVVELNHTTQLINFFQSTIEAYHVNALYFNDQYEINEVRRDQKIIAALTIPVHHYTDQIIFHPADLMTHKKTPYTIFTPYKKSFIQAVLKQQSIAPLADIAICHELKIDKKHLADCHAQGIVAHTTPPSSLPGISSSIPAHYWPASEDAAHHRLNQFVATKIQDYQIARDFPAQNTTSQLSPYLACGVLSSRQCFARALKENQGKIQGGQPGIDTWITELIWREFYKQILAHFPKVSMHHAFKSQTESWPWRHDMKLFQAWANAETGYPLIDAAMRQLHQTGWMHNRLRMVVAMFLTKDCFIDWRLGEGYFIEHLIDGDLAANNGGWQWAASTGCDAVPYFRVFNPVRQSMRFDPEGIFIKTYCPELKKVPIKLLHDPFNLPLDLSYPKPIVDYRQTRTSLRNLLNNPASPILGRDDDEIVLI